MKCYICNGKIITYLDNDSQCMITWNLQKKELCDICYKNHISGISVYIQNNPDWIYPKVKEDE